MTKEEIIHRLQYARHRIDNVTYAPDVLKAIDIAIEAVGNTDADTISRAKAIEALDKRFDSIPMEQTSEILMLRKDLRDLPPAQLGTNLAEVGTDCISRQAAIKALKDATFDFEACKIVLEQLPPIQPEIIRCKDCKYWMPYDWMFSEVWRSKNMADYPEDEMGCNWCDMAMKADDFCSRAERREVTT